jgi:hypothetical protein
MRSLANKANVVAPSVEYPYGQIKDNTGGNNGTPVNEAVYGDFHQFFEKLMAVSGVTANDLPENATNGFQLIEALKKLIARDGIFLQSMVVEIGDWNMDTTSLKAINLTTLGLTAAKIRSVDVLIRSDDDIIVPDSRFPLLAGNSGVATGGFAILQATNMLNLFVNSGSIFDTSDFDKTSYNRGWVTIWYTE